MFEVRNNKDEQVRSATTLTAAKKAAEEMATADKKHKFGHGPFSIWEVKQVWTTQTLDEALGNQPGFTSVD